MSNPAADFPADLHDPTDISANASSPLGSTNPTHTQVHGKVEEELVEIQRKLGTGASPAASADENQVLTVNADGSTSWKDPTAGSGAVDSVNGQTGTVTLDIDDVAPTQTGNAGKVLKTDGTNATWQTDAGGSVDSVNGQTGTVSLDADDIDDTSTTNKFATQAQLDAADSAVQPGDLATVATTGDYNDLSNSPDLSVYDEVEQYADLGSFPGTGNSAKFYLAQDTGIMYRWTGSAYTVISAQLALGETSSTAYRGDRGKTAYDHSQLTSGNPHSVSKTDVGLGNVDNTSDANKPVSTATQAALDLKQDILSEGAFTDGDKTKLDGIEALADVTDTANVDAAGATMNTDTTLAGNSYFLDEDNMASDSATKVPSQQSVKAYADTKQPLDSDLTTIAGLTATTDNFIQAKSSAWASRTPAQVAADLTHNNLGGLTTGDPHTQYALLTGRSGGQTLIGGTAASNNLLLRSTSNSTKGYISIGDSPSTKVFIGGTSAPLYASATFGVNTAQTFSAAGSMVGSDFRSSPTFNTTNGGSWTTADFTATPVATANMASVTGVAFQAGASGAGTVTEAVGMIGFATSTGAPTTTSVSSKLQVGGFIGAVTTAVGANVVNGQFFGSTTNAVGFMVSSLPGSTSKIGIDVANLTGATTNIGIRNASTTVNTPATAQNITAAATALTITSSVKQITADNNYTLSAAPTIADGQDGQVVTIINVDTTDTITLQDQGTLASSNLRLTASTVALAPRQSIKLMYSSTVGDWVQVGNLVTVI